MGMNGKNPGRSHGFSGVDHLPVGSFEASHADPFPQSRHGYSPHHGKYKTALAQQPTGREVNPLGVTDTEDPRTITTSGV